MRCLASKLEGLHALMPEPASKLAGFQLPRLGKHDSSVKILHRGNIR